MKFLNINMKRVAPILLSGCILVGTAGCSNVQVKVQPTLTVDQPAPIESIVPIEPVVSEKPEALTSEEKEQAVVDKINEYGDTIDKYVNKENVEKVADTTWGAFTSAVDFIFYGSEISGVTFDELSDAGKEKVVESFQKMYGSMETKFPDFTEKATDLLTGVASTGKKLFGKLDAFLDEKIGFQEIKDSIGAAAQKGIGKISDWYQNHR